MIEHYNITFVLHVVFEGDIKGKLCMLVKALCVKRKHRCLYQQMCQDLLKAISTRTDSHLDRVDLALNISLFF